MALDVRRPEPGRARDPMTVVFVVTELGRGGAETQLKRIAEVMRARGNRVTVISLMTPVGYAEELGSAGVRVESLELRRGQVAPRALVRARRLLRCVDPDVLCCFLYHATLLGVAAATGLRAPVVSSIRDPSFGGRGRLYLLRALVRARRIQALVANNETVAVTLREREGFPRAVVHHIPNGLRLPDAALDPRHREGLRRAVGVEDGEFLWLHVGNFQAPKDHANLLRAFERVVRVRPEARLRMVGLGEPPPVVAALMQREPIVSRAAHLGERHDVLELMQASDGVVLSSSSEGLPNVLMEALGVGTPVVSTDVGGVRELVEHGVNGVLVPPRDDEALAAGMVRLMCMSDDERRGMQVRGRQRIHERYDLDRIVDQWEALFGRLSRPADGEGWSRRRRRST